MAAATTPTQRRKAAPAEGATTPAKKPKQKKKTRFWCYFNWAVAILALGGIFAWFELTGKREGGWVSNVDSGEALSERTIALLKNAHAASLGFLTEFHKAPEGKEFASQWMDMMNEDREGIVDLARVAVLKDPIISAMPGSEDEREAMLGQLAMEAFNADYSPVLAEDGEALLGLLQRVLLRQENQIIKDEIAAHEREMEEKEAAGFDGGDMEGVRHIRKRKDSEIQESMMMFRSVVMGRFLQEVIGHWDHLNAP